jgi:diaminohydroxyphosphoribosylaminopyrimidine deaminase/5-amino-6-(5-phosphoribosylamino)uracil reductase
MQQAFALAALGEGSVSPNPRVGCVVARDGRIVGRGWHRAPGRAHAEVRAVDEAGDASRGATLYVNLEPCAHHGRTPPCTERLIRGDVTRVVASVVDPNPLVDGRGFAALREAGVEVEVGLLAEEARRLNDAFFHFHDRGRPRVTLKAAVSVDGMLAAANGRSQWITSETARRFAHRLRYRHDAVLVGAETVRRDDPRLTVRLPGISACRLRAVLAPSLDLDPGARLFERDGDGQAPVVLYAAEDAAARHAERFAGRAEVVALPADAHGLRLDALLDDLAARDVLSLLVEGGARTFAGFVRAGLADRAAVFTAPRVLGGRGGTPLLDLPVVGAPSEGLRILAERRVPLGADWLLLGPVIAPAPAPGAGKEDGCSPG